MTPVLTVTMETLQTTGSVNRATVGTTRNPSVTSRPGDAAVTHGGWEDYGVTLVYQVQLLFVRALVQL